MAFLQYLSSIISVTDELKEALEAACDVVDVARGERLVRSGERCHYLYFIEQGLLRGYYYNQDKEITGWFAREGEFATSFYAFITGKPSMEDIEALEDSRLMRLSYTALQALYVQHPLTERIGRLLTEAYYVKLEGRLLGLQFTSAKDRYHDLLNAHPQLVQRAPLGYIASYLGITQETLSRIRAQY